MLSGIAEDMPGTSAFEVTPVGSSAINSRSSLDGIYDESWV